MARIADLLSQQANLKDRPMDPEDPEEPDQELLEALRERTSGNFTLENLGEVLGSRRYMSLVDSLESARQLPRPAIGFDPPPEAGEVVRDAEHLLLGELEGQQREANTAELRRALQRGAKRDATDLKTAVGPEGGTDASGLGVPQEDGVGPFRGDIGMIEEGLNLVFNRLDVDLPEGTQTGPGILELLSPEGAVGMASLPLFGRVARGPTVNIADDAGFLARVLKGRGVREIGEALTRAFSDEAIEEGARRAEGIDKGIDMIDFGPRSLERSFMQGTRELNQSPRGRALLELSDKPPLRRTEELDRAAIETLLEQVGGF